MDLLVAFEAYIIYSIMVFFSSDHGNSLIDRQVMITLEAFACDVATTGLVCPAETSKSRSDWGSWIVVSTKHGTLYALYLFDNRYCSEHGLPAFLGEELASPCAREQGSVGVFR
jgi:hypothetical protein